MDGNTVKSARIALGGVAHKPWRAEESERMLLGKRLDKALLADAGAAAVRGAVPLRDNGFKIELAKRAVMRALENAAGVAGGVA
jgi:xanthine dehydrogenase YagS FAD-binding subunit